MSDRICLTIFALVMAVMFFLASYIFSDLPRLWNFPLVWIISLILTMVMAFFGFLLLVVTYQAATGKIEVEP